MKRHAGTCVKTAESGICRFLGRLLLVGTVFFTPAARAWDYSAPHLIDIERADILFDADDVQPPSDSKAWQPVALPDDWRERRPGVKGVAWYRIHLDLPQQPSKGQAVFIRWVRGFGTCFINGIDVGRFGELTYGERAVMYEFSPRLLHAGANTVHVKLAVDDDGELGSVQIGDKSAALMAYRLEYFLHVTLAQIGMLICAGLGTMTFVIWLGRRRDEMFGWFTVAALSFFLYVAPLPTEMPQWIIPTLAIGPMTASISIYCLRFAGWRWPRFEVLVWVVSAIFPVEMLILVSSGIEILPTPADTILFRSQFALPLLLTVYIGWRLRSWEAWLLALGHLSNIAMILTGLPLHGFNFFCLHFVPVCLVMALILIRRFVRALNEAEMLNTQLAARVEEKRQALEANYRRLADLEREQAVVAERARLMRDMHDGIGGQLISTLSLVETGGAPQDKVATALRECLDDLRLTIDSLEPADDDLVPVLGNLRYRLEPRLKAGGVGLEWRVDEMPRLANMTPQNVLHVLRILQEALTNVIKHAGASHVCVSTRQDGGRVMIDVRDDGKGMSEGGESPRGHGLANMRQRAQALGGELHLQATGVGTTVTLGLPTNFAPTP